jgi:ribosomal protein S27AE
MTASRNLDTLLALFAALAWAFAVFALGSRFLSPAVGGLVGLGLLISGLSAVLSMYVRDSRLEALSRGNCPRCGNSVQTEHEHRRWLAERRTWLRPATTWDCPACSYSHSEAWGCPRCPE